MTPEDRCQIHALKKSGLSHRAIAHILERAPRIVNQEISRNTRACGYRHKQAHGKAASRRSLAFKRKRPLWAPLIFQMLLSRALNSHGKSSWMRLIL